MTAILKFSIIIPSFNEGDDIRISIESAMDQNYPPHEIIVVDDSSDNTPSIIAEYQNRGVRLIKGEKKGCCGARNLGMKKATGDIIVLLNGDVRLPSDFLEKIKKHYDAGADYVLVESKVFNTENFWARFIEIQHRYTSRKIGKKAEWTEGFSAKRQAVESVGFIPGNFPIRFCRDWFLGRNLKLAGFKKVIDLSIIVPHKAPDNFKEYWRVRKARGRFGAYTQHFLHKKTLFYLTAKFLFKSIIVFLKFALIVPAIISTVKISKHSDHPAQDFIPFLYTYFLQEIARSIGEWEGILNVNFQRAHYASY